MERQVLLVTQESDIDAHIDVDFSNWVDVDWLSLGSRVVKHVERESIRHSFARAMNSEHCPFYRCLTSRSHFISSEHLSGLRLVL